MKRGVIDAPSGKQGLLSGLAWSRGSNDITRVHFLLSFYVLALFSEYLWFNRSTLTSPGPSSSDSEVSRKINSHPSHSTIMSGLPCLSQRVLLESHAHPWTAPSVSRGRILMKGQVQVTTVNLRFVSQLQSLYCKFPPFSLGSQNWSLLFGVKRTLVQAESSHDPKEEKEKASLNITSQEYHPYFCSKNFNDGYLHIPKMDSNCNMKYKMCIILYTLDEKPKISTKNCYSLLLILGKNYILRIYDFHTQSSSLLCPCFQSSNSLMPILTASVHVCGSCLKFHLLLSDASYECWSPGVEQVTF